MCFEFVLFPFLRTVQNITTNYVGWLSFESRNFTVLQHNVALTKESDMSRKFIKISSCFREYPRIIEHLSLTNWNQTSTLRKVSESIDRRDFLRKGRLENPRYFHLFNVSGEKLRSSWLAYGRRVVSLDPILRYGSLSSRWFLRRAGIAHVHC
jgi:hypothetical protein